MTGRRQFNRSSRTRLKRKRLRFSRTRSIRAARLPGRRGAVAIACAQGGPMHHPLPRRLPHRMIRRSVARRSGLYTYKYVGRQVNRRIARRLRCIPTGLSIVTRIHPGCTYGHYSRAISVTPVPSLFLPGDVTAPDLMTRTVIDGCRSRLPLCHRRRV